MRILIVEDDRLVSAALRRSLRALYVMDTADTGAEALHLADVSTYDAILLDLYLPDMAGLEVCRELRASGCIAPIMVLTGQEATENKINLLDAGADDYLTKPFSVEELKARLRALTRRESSPSTSARLEVGAIIMDTATREVWRENISIKLRRKEFDLLQYLMRRAGKVVTRSMIIDNVWDANDNLWTNSIDVHIKYLRDRIDRPFKEKMITTVHGVGYKLEVLTAALARE